MARKAEREAQQKAVDAYNEQWKKIKRIEGVQNRKLSTRDARVLDDELDGELSYGTKRLAREADKKARELNKLQPRFKESVDKYNRRIDELQRQLNNKSVSKEYLNERRSEAKAQYEQLKGEREAAQQKLRDPIANLTGGGYARMNSIQDQARNISTSQSQSHGYQNVMGHFVPTKEETQAQDMSLNADMYYGPATSWRKTLPAHEQAAKDLNRLGDEVSSHTEYQNIAQQYKELADSIKTRLRREQAPVKQQGLLSSELASNAGPLANEGIR